MLDFISYGRSDRSHSHFHEEYKSAKINASTNMIVVKKFQKLVAIVYCSDKLFEEDIFYWDRVTAGYLQWTELKRNAFPSHTAYR